MKKYSPYKMKGHTLPGINQKPSPAKTNSALSAKLISLGITLGMPMMIMKGADMQMGTSAMAKGGDEDAEAQIRKAYDAEHKKDK